LPIHYGIVRYSLFGFKFQDSGFRAARLLVSRFKIQVSGFKFQVSSFKIQGSEAAGTEFWGIISVIPHRKNKIPSPNYLSM